MRIVAKVIASICFGFAVYHAVKGSEVPAGTWTGAGVVWICLWAEL